MLHKYELSVAKEEAEKVDTLRYTWEKLLSRSTELQNELVALQPNFREELVSNVETFLEDCQQFYQDYDKVMTRLMSSRLILQFPLKSQTAFASIYQTIYLYTSKIAQSIN